MLKRMFGPWRFRRAAGAADDMTPVVRSLDTISDFTSGGTTVTITGRNFRAVDGSGTPPTVRFGSVVATSVVVVNAQTITCVAPASLTTGVVAVSVQIGTQIGTLPYAFAYYKTTVSGLSPNHGTTLGATRVMISGRNFVTGSTITMGGVAATAVTFIDAEHLACTTPAHASGVGDVIITDPAARTTVVYNGFKWTTLGRGGDIRRSPGVRIHETLGSTPNTASFVIDGESNCPTEGEFIELVDSFDGDRVLFRGFASTVGEAYEGQTDQLAYQVQAIDFTPKLNRRRPFAAYFNQSASDVVRDMVARFAPGFTANHVESGLNPVTVSFDGTRDFTTCLSEVVSQARAKWKCDYDQDVHVFTAVNAVFKPIVSPIPSTPQPLTSVMTVAAVKTYPGFAYPAGYYIFRHTFLFADGSESSPQSCANVVYGDGQGQFYFTNVPTGPTLHGSDGDIACVGRRVYVNYLGTTGATMARLTTFCQVDDNTTTEFTTLSGLPGSGDVLALPVASTVLIPDIPFSSPYPAPKSAPVATAQHSAEGTGRAWVQFRVAYLYRDGSWSWAGPVSASVGVNTNSDLPLTGFALSEIPTGPAVGSLDVIARLIYICTGALFGTETRLFAEPDWSDARVVPGLLVLPGNVTTTLNVAWPLPMIGLGNAPMLQATSSGGADLENDDPVGDLTDDNPDLLHMDSGSQGFTVTRDCTQVRNRIFVVGASTTVAVDCPAGNPTQGKVRFSGSMDPNTPPEGFASWEAWAAAQGDQFSPYYLQIADGRIIPPTGGMLRMVEAKTLQVYNWYCHGVYDAVPSGRSWIADLVTGRQILMVYDIGVPEMEVAAGSKIGRYYEYNDYDSQAYMARLEPGTDGVYEYTVVDSTLVTEEQMRARALAEKEMYGWPIVTINYATRDKRTKPGKTVHVNMASPPCYGDFLIQDVQIDQIRDESDELAPRYTVTASSMRMDLNDLLLALTKPVARDVVHVPVLPQIFSVGSSPLGADYIQLTGVGFAKGTKVFFDGVEATDVVID